MPITIENKWIGFNPGLLHHSVEIQRAIETQDDVGHPITSWVTIYTRRSYKRRVTGGETFSGHQLHAEATDLFVLRYVSGVITKDRILFDSRIFDILEVDDLEDRKLWVFIQTKERV